MMCLSNKAQYDLPLNVSLQGHFKSMYVSDIHTVATMVTKSDLMEIEKKLLYEIMEYTISLKQTTR